MVPRRGIIILIIQILVVLAFFLTLNYSSKSSISSIPSAIVNKTQSDISTPHATTHHCPPNLEPTCTNDWILDGFDSMRIRGGEITTFKQSNGTFTKNSTELKLCHFSNESQRAMNYNSNKGSMMLAGVLPSSGVLLKCNNALIEFRTKHQVKGGIFPTVTCGHPLQNNDTTNSIISYNVSAVLGTDILGPWTYQHAVKDGLGLSAMIWNHVKDVPNLHVLVGDFNELWYYLRGEEHAINAPVEQKGGTMWFRHLYIGTVPSEITPSEWLTQQPTKDTMRSIQKGKSDLLPCSLSSMVGFQKWRAEFSSSSNQEFQSNTNNNTLLYLQRLGRSGTYRMGNFVFFDCSGPDVAASCNCTKVSEDDFIQRLDLLSRHLGLTLEVFRSDNRKKDAETFAKAKVVIGPHGEMYHTYHISSLLASTF